MFTSGRPSSEIIDEIGLRQISDPEEINEIVKRVLDENPQQVDQYLKGKHTLADWFFGQVMRITQSRANPKLVRKALESQLKGVEENQPPR